MNPTAGHPLRSDDKANGAQVRQPPDHLAKVYVEPTNRCNLECRTCIRHGWDEPLGQMEEATFTRIMDGCAPFRLPHDLFRRVRRAAGSPAYCRDGGAGEGPRRAGGAHHQRNAPHPGRVAAIDFGGARSALVSLDGATPESYTDVRLGAALPQVLANLAAFRDARALAPERATPGSASRS